jgi:hypothetical protein
MAIGLKKRLFVPFAIIFFLSFLGRGRADDYQVVCDLLKHMKANVNALNDYTLTQTRRERVKDYLFPEETTFVKFKRPFCLYFKYLDGKHKGREVIFVRGKNNDKMIVSAGGLFSGLTVRISPESILARKESRHVITEAGLPNLVERITSMIENVAKIKCGEMKLTYFGASTFMSQKVIRVQVDNSDYASRTEICVDARTYLPVSIISYDKDNRILESFRYADIKPNVGLTDADFDPKNPGYHF